VVPAGAEIGWSVTPEWAQARASGLTIVAPRLRRGATEDRESSAIGA
jgi:hypothetical protein